MSLENEQAAEAANEQSAAVEEQFAEADAQADPSNEVPSLEDLASSMGWVPQDKFSGPAEKWKPAHQFIRDGKDIQERTSRELKEIRTTLETVSRTSGAIMAEKLQQQREELARRYEAAVEKGDRVEAAEALRNFDATTAALNSGPPRAGPAPETQSWVEHNAKVKADPVAWQRALQVCDAYARSYPNSSPAEQLAYTEQNLKREFPHLFDNKPAPNVNGDISRNSGGVSRGGTTYADLPREAKAVADDLADRGLIGSKDDYAKHYFAEKAKRAA
jgi:predicted ArsR family transcriptional regulator